MPTARRRKRRSTRGVFRLKKPIWRDPFPQIPGTRPEKRLFEALWRRGIYFIFQGDLPAEDRFNSPLLQPTDFKPDFIVPEWKIIYDPFGDFAHTQTDSIVRDRIKSVLYQALGYEFIHPWSTELEEFGGDWMVDLSHRIHGPKLFKLPDKEKPFFAHGYRIGENVGLGATSVAAANSKRTKVKPRTIRRRVGRGRRRL